jgi:hypothetical protein
MQPCEHGSQRSLEHARDLLRREAVDVDQHEGDPVQVGEASEHGSHILCAELLEEVEVERVGIGKRILVGDLPEERELLRHLEADLLWCPRSCPPAVSTDVDEDAGEPGRSSGRMLQAVESPVRLEQGVLNGILGFVADEAPGDRVEARKLLLREDSEPLFCVSLRIGRHGIGFKERRQRRRSHCTFGPMQ